MHQYFKLILFGHGIILKTILSRTYLGLKFQRTNAVHQETKLLGNDLTQIADLISGGLFLIISTHHSELFEGTRFLRSAFYIF